jgi:hypothetical protein
LLRDLVNHSLRFRFDSDPYHDVSVDTLAERFERSPDRISGLKVSSEQHGIDRIAVESTRDLETLAAFYVSGVTASLCDPTLGAALQVLERHGLKFFKPGGMVEDRFNWDDHRVRKFGLYGAYKEFTDGKQASHHEVIAGARCAHGVPLPERLSVLALPCFEYGGSADGLPQPALATAVRDRSQAGYSFHEPGGKKLSALQAWHHWVAEPDGALEVGLHGTNPRRMVAHDLLQPTTAEEQARLDFCQREIQPRLEAGRLHRGREADMLQARFASIAGLEMKPEAQWQLACRLEALEARSGPVPMSQALDDLNVIAGGARRLGASAAVTAYETLLGALPSDEAREGFDQLLRLVNESPYDNEPPLFASDDEARQAFVGLLVDVGDATAGEQVWNAIARQRPGEPFGERLAAFRQCLQAHAPCTGEAARQRGLEALADYLCAADTRTQRQSLDEAVGQFVTLRQGMRSSADAASIRDCHRWLQQQGDGALGRFLNAWLTRRDVEAAKQAVTQPLQASVATPGIKRHRDGSLVIAGVRVPRRSGAC